MCGYSIYREKQLRSNRESQAHILLRILHYVRFILKFPKKFSTWLRQFELHVSCNWKINVTRKWKIASLRLKRWLSGQWFTALAEDPRSVPSTHMEAHNCLPLISRVSAAFFCSSHWHFNTEGHTLKTTFKMQDVLFLQGCVWTVVAHSVSRKIRSAWHTQNLLHHEELSFLSHYPGR